MRPQQGTFQALVQQKAVGLGIMCNIYPKKRSWYSQVAVCCRLNLLGCLLKKVQLLQEMKASLMCFESPAETRRYEQNLDQECNQVIFSGGKDCKDCNLLLYYFRERNDYNFLLCRTSEHVFKNIGGYFPDFPPLLWA